MQSKHKYETVNTITWVPEGGAWGATEDFRYANPKRTGQKALLLSLLVGVCFSFYDPMTTYRPEVIHEVEITLADHNTTQLQVNRTQSVTVD